MANPHQRTVVDPSASLHVNDLGVVAFGPGDGENPRLWSITRRWYCTISAISLVVNSTFASSSPSASLESLSEDFSSTRELSSLVISLFLLGFSAGPLIFAPLSEVYGRRWILYWSFTGYLALNFLCAFAPSLAALLVGRFLSGTFASAPLAIVPGLLVDLWTETDRGNAMAIYALMSLQGPALGPVISGFLEQEKDWRWTYYVLLWMGGFTALLMFTIPETYPPAILAKKLRRLKTSRIRGYAGLQDPTRAQGISASGNIRVALSRPWRILFDPISLMITLYICVIYQLQYMLFIIYPIVFRQQRGWAPGISELPLIGTAVGGCVGAIGFFFISVRDRQKLRDRVALRPEDRLPLAMVGSIIFPASMFWFAWSANFISVHWLLPTVAGGVLSCSMILIFVAHLNYLTDTYSEYSASAVAANVVCRAVCGAAAPLFTQSMFDALGVGGGGSLLGGVGVLLAPIPFLLFKYGENIRSKSRFTSM